MANEKEGRLVGGLYEGASIERKRCVHHGTGREADALLSAVAARILGDKPDRFRWNSVLLHNRKSQDVH